MALGNAEAEACAQEIIAKIDSLSDTQKEDKNFIWKEVMKILYSRIKADAELAGSVSGVTDVGPAGGPLPISDQPVTGTLQ